jgi:pimeloyl-ACP methyl ester carboxylesterase
MDTVLSRDGTRIAFDKQGAGPALIVVDGALCSRSSGTKPALVELLASHLTVYSYDRRGRGDSGDTPPYAVAREVEDIAALIEAAGGAAGLYGHSSGASLALEAAAQLGRGVVGRLAMYEAPYNDDPEARRAWSRYLDELAELLQAGRRGDAVALFMGYVGVPAEQIEGMRQSPWWPALEALGPTLAYDHAGILGRDGSVPADRAAQVEVATLVMYGEASFGFMADTARALAAAISRAELRSFAGQGHDVHPEVLAPVLVEFFTRDVAGDVPGAGARDATRARAAG